MSVKRLRWEQVENSEGTIWGQVSATTESPLFLQSWKYFCPATTVNNDLRILPPVLTPTPVKSLLVLCWAADDSSDCKNRFTGGFFCRCFRPREIGFFLFC